MIKTKIKKIKRQVQIEECIYNVDAYTFKIARYPTVSDINELSHAVPKIERFS